MKNLNFDLAGILKKFPININQIKENENLIHDKDLLLIVETFDNKIICLFLNRSNLPKKSFYLFINDNKIFYYKKKKGSEVIEKNEFYRDENSHIRYKYNKETIENVGELKSFFFDGFFRLINDMDSYKCKEIEVFEILTE